MFKPLSYCRKYKSMQIDRTKTYRAIITLVNFLPYDLTYYQPANRENGQLSPEVSREQLFFYEDGYGSLKKINKVTKVKFWLVLSSSIIFHQCPI